MQISLSRGQMNKSLKRVDFFTNIKQRLMNNSLNASASYSMRNTAVMRLSCQQPDRDVLFTCALRTQNSQIVNILATRIL